jgi:hypothetical protein
LKNLFPGFYRPSDAEFTKLWSEATFIFDTNVLLDLYSYPEDLRKVYFSVLSKLENRLWIPYQVGLEFHRNRFSRIKQENKRVADLLKTISETGEKISQEVKSIELEKRNIGISNIDERLNAIQETHKTLADAVQLACNKLPPISLDDPIGEEICTLLEGRVGAPPSDQAALDLMLHEAQARFDQKIPPGFMDQRKGDALSHDRGVTYPDKFGDLILWKQILNHASTNKISAIVFVTRDSKKDWWWEEDGKTLGPLPQLVQEIADVGVSPFWLYTPDKFLQHAEIHLQATEVTPEAVQQVKELSIQVGEAKIYSKVNPVIGGSSVLEAMEQMSRLMRHEDMSMFNNYYYGATPTQRPMSATVRLPAVSVEQDTESGESPDYNREIIRIHILRDTAIATGSGKLKPAMSEIPFVIAKLEKMPDGYSTDHIKYSAGTGTCFDFNINIKSVDYNIPLPIGEYVFSYEAKTTARTFPN